jgi:hypothetical protein
MQMKLFMVLLGCKPKGRNTEQHDLFFGIGESLSDIKEDMLEFWEEANGRMHIDGWREINFVEGYKIEIAPKDATTATQTEKLFFINLGGYKPNEFEEFHYKLVTVAAEKGAAIQKARQTAFYKHTGFAGATSHVDDKYGIDVDDIYEIEDILPIRFKDRYHIMIIPAEGAKEDEMHLGYLKMDKI